MPTGYVDDVWIRQQTDHLSKYHHETAVLFFSIWLMLIFQISGRHWYYSWKDNNKSNGPDRMLCEMTCHIRGALCFDLRIQSVGGSTFRTKILHRNFESFTNHIFFASQRSIFFSSNCQAADFNVERSLSIDWDWCRGDAVSTWQERALPLIKSSLLHVPALFGSNETSLARSSSQALGEMLDICLCLIHYYNCSHCLEPNHRVQQGDFSSLLYGQIWWTSQT